MKRNTLLKTCVVTLIALCLCLPVFSANVNAEGEEEIPVETQQPEEQAVEETEQDETDAIATQAANDSTITVMVGQSKAISGSSPSSSNSWYLKNSADSEYVDVSGNGNTTTITGKKITTSPVTVVRKYGWPWQNTEEFTIEVVQAKAAIYYLNRPDGLPGSNDIGYWAPTSDTSTLLADIDPTGATWENNKNIVSNVSSYIVSWPDKSTGEKWTVKRDDPITGTDFTFVLNSIWNAYKSSIESSLGITGLQKEDVSEITLIPYKISKNNSNTENQYYHIDCTIDVKSSKVFTAKFNVLNPDATDYTQIDAKNYKIGDSVEKTSVEVSPTITGPDGVTYVFDGWYEENESGGPYGTKVTEWPNTPTDAQLADGTVNYYAHYVPAYTSLTVSKVVTGNLGDRSIDFTFHATITDKNGNGVTGITGENIIATDTTGGYQFTLKNGESLTLENIPTGSNVVVSEDTSAVTGYTVSYKADGATESAAGNTCTLENMSVLENNASHTVEFTNNKEAIPQTGIFTDSMPYILLLGIAGIGFVVMRRRHIF